MGFFDDLVQKIGSAIYGARVVGVAPIVEGPDGAGAALAKDANGLLVSVAAQAPPATAPLPTGAATQTTLAALLAAVATFKSSANHTLHDSNACTAGARAFSCDKDGTYTYRLLNDAADRTAYLAAGMIVQGEPKLIKSTGSPSGAVATLWF